MGVYEKHIVPRLAHLALNNGDVRRARKLALEEVEGDVLELGIGTGLNLPHYGKNVRRVVGVEPSETAARLARKEIAKVSFPVDIEISPAEALAREDEFDAVVSTFTLCTIPDLVTALAQAKRALRPNGRFFFLEHGLSTEPAIQKWQRRLEPLEKALAGGCHLTRDPKAVIAAAGFAVEKVEMGYLKGPKPWTFVYRGTARAT
jgi:SAM-dependent methyltransferase